MAPRAGNSENISALTEALRAWLQDAPESASSRPAAVLSPRHHVSCSSSEVLSLRSWAKAPTAAGLRRPGGTGAEREGTGRDKVLVAVPRGERQQRGWLSELGAGAITAPSGSGFATCWGRG